MRNAFCSFHKAAVFGLYLLFACLHAWATKSEREHLSLDGDWKFTYTHPTNTEVLQLPPADAYVSTIQVPGWWEEQLEGFRNAPWFEQAEFRETQGPVKYLAGIGWYRKTFEVPEAWRDRAVTLTIGRSITIVRVWLNGRPIAGYDYGVYTPFEVDLSRELEYGKSNELVIAVDNSRGFAGGWAYLGNQGQASGITESVTMDVSPGPDRFAVLFIRPGKDLKEVEWNVELKMPTGSGSSGPSSIAWEVWSADKKHLLGDGRVQVPAFEKKHTLSWRAGVNAIEPWSDRHPNLYWTRLSWGSSTGQPWDEMEQRFGLRRFRLDGRKLLLNDKPIYLRGSFGHYYFPLSGSPRTDKAYWAEKISRLKSMGFNYINFAAEV